jgi:type I restriction enzyme S subunit
MSSGWKTVHLRDVGECRRGVSYKSPDDLRDQESDGTVRLLRSTNIQDGRVVLDDVHVVDDARCDDGDILQTGDVVICIANGSRDLVGKSAVFRQSDKRRYVVGAFCARFRPREVEDAAFLGYVFASRTYRHWIRVLLGGTNINNLKPGDILQCPVQVPCESRERSLIADALGHWDAAIDRGRDLLAACRSRKQGLMQRLLTGRNRLATAGGRWLTVKLGDVLTTCDRYVEWSDGTAYRFASVRRRSGGLFDRGTFYGREVGTKVLKLLGRGDFVISKRQVVHGAWAMVTEAFEGFGVSDEYDVLVNKDPKVLDMRFFNYLSQTRRLWHMAYLASKGVHIEKLIFDFQDFAKEKIQIPPTVEEQAAIVEVLFGCDREIELLRRELELLEEQKRGLMEKLLTGEVQVKC